MSYLSPVFRAVLLACVLAAWVSGQAVGQDSVVLRIEERAGVARTDEPVASGIPLPRAWGVSDASTLRLTDATGIPVPAQFNALARWGAAADATTAPVRWVLAQFAASVPASGTVTFTLDRTGPGPAPPLPLSVSDPVAGRIRVDTGAALFDINTDSFNLLDQVTIGGRALLDPLLPNEALRYRPVGGLDILTSGALPDLTPRPTDVTVESEGQLAAVLRARGSLLNASGQAVLDYTARLHFAAGSADVRLDFTVENNHPIIEDFEGQPANLCDQRSTNSVYVGSLQLRLRLAETSGTLHSLAEWDIDIEDPGTSLTIYQDSSGTDYWDAYVGQVGWSSATAHPRLQSYCSFSGFEIQNGDLPWIAIPGANRGRQSEGWVAAYRTGADGGGMCLAVRDIWQDFPKAVTVEPDGTIAVDLFPQGEKFFHNFRVGEQKTHSILLSFAQGPITNQEAERRARAFNGPLFAVAPALWYVNSGALGEVTVEDVSSRPLYERYCRTAFEPNPDFDPAIHDPNFGNRTLSGIVRHYNMYGWQDYGDFPLDYEAFGDNQAGQMNQKYWYTYGLLLHFCRSADPRWLDLALPAARHVSDLDFCHIPDEGVQHWAHGAFFGHAAHNEPGNWNPNRNYGRPMLNLFYGVPDLILAYHLTGERRFLDVALEGLQGIENLLPFSDYPGGDIGEGLGRDTINFLFAYLEGYRQTGNPALLDRMRYVLGHTADFSTKEWVTSPTAYVPPTPEQAYVRTFMFVQCLWGLGRYLDFLDEYGLPDDGGVESALQAYADFIVDFAMQEYAPGRAALWYDNFFDGLHDDPGQGRDYNYLDINNWSLVAADALAYTAKHTGSSRYLDAAEMFYRTGSIDPVWEDDPPVYMSTKDLVNSLNWGLVYMRQSGAPPSRTASRAHWSLYP